MTVHRVMAQVHRRLADLRMERGTHKFSDGDLCKSADILPFTYV